MLTESEFSEIENRCSAAQRGPWMVKLMEHKLICVGTHSETAVRVDQKLLSEEVRQQVDEWDVKDDHGFIRPCPQVESMTKSIQSTLEFIAYSRTDVPKLLEEIKRLKRNSKDEV